MKTNITVQPHGRTGNRLFQYALGLILAKNKNANFCAETIPFFENISIQTLKPNTAKTFKTSTFGNHDYNYELLINTKDNILIDSYVQKAKLLIEYREFLKEQFYFKNTLQELPTNNELVMHIRENDYKNINAYLGDDFYKCFIKKQTKYTNITIITDNIQAPLIQELKSQGCKIFTKQTCYDWQYPYFTYNDTNDFNYMLYAKHLFISQSSFSWWAAFLGEHQQIFFPYKLNNKADTWELRPEKDRPDLFFDFGNSKKIIL